MSDKTREAFEALEQVIPSHLRHGFMGKRYDILHAALAAHAEEVKRLREALDLLDKMFTAYENGVDVYEDPEDCAGHMGHAVKLDDETFHACADLLDSLRPRAALQGDK